ncbi:phosphatase [Succinivibrio dextrinosolvens]|uniref:phosphatase n=1 Tax=Succinivibrio dextrinosolvens TaxID=83771 RepID=UPI00247ACEE7|nr:phosphatase [Succinivibrio dextrinosolvens]
MQFFIDLHTHTIASDHAYSTIVECVNYAKNNGIVMFATTDHGPALEDGPHPWHFNNLKVVPRICDGVAVLRGIEANIDKNGDIDVTKAQLEKVLDIVLAGFHPSNPPSDADAHTKMYLKVIESGNVDVITHPGCAAYPCDYEQVLLAAKEHNVAIEINSSSDVNTRFGSHDNCVEIAKLAKKIGNTISIGSDAHICYYMCNFEPSIEIIKNAGISEEQIINTSPNRVLDFLESRGHRSIPEMREFFKNK